jgi:hypothetical protein
MAKSVARGMDGETVSAKSKAQLGALDRALSAAQDLCGTMVTVEARESKDAGDRAAHRHGTEVWNELEKLRHRIAKDRR